MLPKIHRSGYRGRYAPSPTGSLHLGNLRTAIIAHDEARAAGGTFILRVEDTDLPRNVPGAEDELIADLQWLGLTWDEGPDIGGPAGPYGQSERSDLYADAVRQLADAGLIYPCHCSRKDLQSGASAPHGADGVVYPGKCRRSLKPGEAEQLITQLLHPSRHPTEQMACLRLRTELLPPLTWIDADLGPQQCILDKEVGDFVVLRRDGLWAYQLVCAVDDAVMGVTHVVRGEDLRSSAARQAAIIRALGFKLPVYRHVPLVLDQSGQRMSKRDGSLGLQQLRADGCGPAEARERILGLSPR